MVHDFNLKLIFRILGTLILVESVLIFSTFLISTYYNESETGFDILKSVGVGTITGLTFLFIGRNANPYIGKREGSIIVTMTWILFTFIGMLPYIFSGSIPNVADAFFETMSGFTTTGSSILNNIESLPYSILFWRSLTHWIGGLGIIVISIAILPVFGFSGIQIFSAEATGPTKDKIHPKISETAKRLLLIYAILTLSETILLRIAGMSWFDAICHSFGTIATGGFSTKQASIAHFNSPLIEYIIIFFMIFSGINFSLFYFMAKMKWEKVLKNEELRTFLMIILIFSILLTISQFDFGKDLTFAQFNDDLRKGLFVTASTISTTGFVTVDYNLWPTYTCYFVIILMIIGSSAGSTAGGMKVIRVLLVFKHSYYEFKRLIHPNAIFPLRYDGHLIPDNIITRVLAFVLLYFILLFGISTLLSFSGLNFIESLSGTLTALSNVGPGFGSLGPVNNFYQLPDLAIWLLSFTMLIGRLEIFTVLLVFSPVFWKK